MVVPQAAARLQQAFGWRVAYAPLVVLALVCLVIAVPVLPHRGEPATAPAVVHNAIGIAVGAGALFAALGQTRISVGLPLAIAALLVLAASLRGLVPAGTFAARPGLPALMLVRAGFGFAVLVTEAFETLAIVAVRHQSTTLAALDLTAGSLGVTTGVLIHHRCAPRRTAERLLRIATVLIAVGLMGFCAGLWPAIPLAVMLAFVVVRYVGWGMATNITQEAVMAMAGSGEEGRVTAVSGMLQTLAFALGPGIGGALVAASIAHGDGPAAGILAAAAASMVTLVALFLIVPRIGRGIAGSPYARAVVEGRAGGQSAAGSSTMNAEPAPGSDSTRMVPSWASTTCRQIANPSPDPSPSR
jgi:predicted MFS family arabinose efflux permease